jgi:hypothetical protein
MGEAMICPACKKPVETHAMYRDGRCPVVVFPAPLRPCPPRELGQR